MQDNSERLALPFTGLVSFLRSPVCFDLDQLDADIAVIGAPTDEGSPWLPGARLAPRAIREMSIRYASYGGVRGHGYWDIDEEKRYLERESRLGRIVDCGDVDIIYTNVEQTFENITTAVRKILARGAMPVVIGGDHAITYAICRAYDEPLDVVHFDAHIDYKPFMHGVQFANGNPIRLVSELAHVGHIVQVGIRSLRTSQIDTSDSRDRGNDVVTVKQIRRVGFESVLSHLKQGGKVYVSIDIDVLDLPLVPGCSSSEVGGLDYYELRDALTYIAAHHEVIGFDLVEVNPMLDVPGRYTSLIAAQTMVEFMARIVEQPQWKTAHNVTD